MGGKRDRERRRARPGRDHRVRTPQRASVSTSTLAHSEFRLRASTSGTFDHEAIQFAAGCDGNCRSAYSTNDAICSAVSGPPYASPAKPGIKVRSLPSEIQFSPVSRVAWLRARPSDPAPSWPGVACDKSRTRPGKSSAPFLPAAGRTWHEAHSPRNTAWRSANRELLVRATPALLRIRNVDHHRQHLAARRWNARAASSTSLPQLAADDRPPLKTVPFAPGASTQGWRAFRPPCNRTRVRSAGSPPGPPTCWSRGTRSSPPFHPVSPRSFSRWHPRPADAASAPRAHLPWRRPTPATK